MTKVTMYRVKDNQKKLNSITSKINQCFISGKKVIVIVPNPEAAQYIDQLLWRLPEESFLPHRISEVSVNDFVVITQKKENLNNANVLFNLCPEIIPNSESYEIIYDLYDESHPTKIPSSIARHAAYEALFGPVTVDNLD